MRIYATVYIEASDTKHYIIVAVTAAKFRTVSDVQYHIVSLLDIQVSEVFIEMLIGKYVLPPAEPIEVFKDEDKIRINVSVISAKPVIKADKHPKEKKHKRNKEAVSKSTKVKRHETKSAGVSHAESVSLVDVGSVWRQMQVSNSDPINVPCKKRRYPQNNDELKLYAEVEEPAIKLPHPAVTDVVPVRSAARAAKPINNKTNYNVLPPVKNISELMVADEIVFKYVTLCEKTFTPTLSQFIKATILQINETSVTVVIDKVDRIEKQYSLGQTVDFRWSEWGEVRMLKKFVPPLPPGPPPFIANSTVSAAVNDHPVPSIDEEVNDFSIFSMFSDDIQRKKSSLVT